MTIEEMKQVLADLDKALIEKGYAKPDCEIEFKADGSFYIWLRADNPTGLTGRVHEFVMDESAQEVVDLAQNFVADLESFQDYAKKQAVQAFGRSIDGLREAGIEASFTDPLAESLQAMTENLLTDQRGAA